MNMKSTIGERIKKIRGLETQEEFASRIGVTQRAVVNYETQGRTPKKAILRKICEQYGVEERWLLTGEGESHKDHTTCDILQASEPESTQPSDFTNTTNNATCDMSQVLGGDLIARCLHLADENTALLRQNGDLRVEVERQRTRIADLERQLEAAQPVKAMEHLEQENRRLRERVRELEKELDRIILHMPPPTDKLQQALPILGSERKP